MSDKKFNVIGIGELLWDVFPEGKELGGAPANFAYHTNFFGGNATIISALGNDEQGKEIRKLLTEKKLNNLISNVDYPTGWVSVELNNGIPNYIIHENVAWDYIELNKEAVTALKRADAICFGSLSQRSQVSFNTIHKALHIVPETALKVLDVNLRQSFYSKSIIEESLRCANILKLNDEELVVLSEMFYLANSQKEACIQLLNQFNLKLLALTNGSKGSILFMGDEISLYPVPKIKVVDTIGAGDSFTASMIMGMLNKKPLKQIHKEATEHAAKVCMNKGGTPNLIESKTYF
ncbi:carbohydrate kinase family protein [Lutibacter flavus]|uniref:Fructokinase n=1 Tax=Lutibacter flavus TaxID=691689 RepID=A0A238XBX6_9FLAO|nr:carbohydrate kinase [Lutibacter flavus]SNR56200.1 fructokinase [Lutibacter flavus]